MFEFDTFAKQVKNQHALDIWYTVMAVYDYIRKHDDFRVTDTTLVVDSHNVKEIEAQFPEIKKFKNMYNMKDFMLFLEYHDTEFYSKMPHSHDDAVSDGSIFFPIIQSEGVKTAFYVPPRETIKVLKVNDVFNLLECDYFIPCAEFAMTTPHVLNVNHFHRPIEIIKNHPDNARRVVCNWESFTHYKHLRDHIA